MAGFPGISANFNEPQTDDTTSAPQVQQPSPVNAVAQILQQKKKKGFGPNVRNPGALAAAIGRAKRARPMTYKYGN